MPPAAQISSYSAERTCPRACAAGPGARRRDAADHLPGGLPARTPASRAGAHSTPSGGHGDLVRSTRCAPDVSTSSGCTSESAYGLEDQRVGDLPDLDPDRLGRGRGRGHRVRQHPQPGAILVGLGAGVAQGRAHPGDVGMDGRCSCRRFCRPPRAISARAGPSWPGEEIVLGHNGGWEPPVVAEVAAVAEQVAGPPPGVAATTAFPRPSSAGTSSRPGAARRPGGPRRARARPQPRAAFGADQLAPVLRRRPTRCRASGRPAQRHAFATRAAASSPV